MSRENEPQQKKNYRTYVRRKISIIFVGIILTILLFFVSVSVGAVSIPIPDIIATLLGGQGTGLYERIIWNIRIPQALTAVVACAGLAIAGVAISSLFSAGLMAIQYFVDDTKLASIVFWQFGDVARASWMELGIITVIVVAALAYILFRRWDYNAIDAGDETARGLDVNVERTRLFGMIAVSVISAVVVAFLGVIGFAGLVCPHMVRRLIGDDHRFLIPGSFVCGAVLLLISDTAARTMIAPHVLPVAVLTAFLGAPVFLYLIIRGRRM